MRSASNLGTPLLAIGAGLLALIGVLLLPVLSLTLPLLGSQAWTWPELVRGALSLEHARARASSPGTSHLNGLQAWHTLLALQSPRKQAEFVHFAHTAIIIPLAAGWAGLWGLLMAGFVFARRRRLTLLCCGLALAGIATTAIAAALITGNAQAASPWLATAAIQADAGLWVLAVACLAVWLLPQAAPTPRSPD